MNVKLLKEVARELRNHPEMFDQNTFATKSDENECGTKCCIAGLTVLLHKPLKFLEVINGDDSKEVINDNTSMPGVIANQARKLLKISKRQALRLFRAADHWPEPFASQYENAETDAARARVGARRIAHFINTGGRE